MSAQYLINKLAISLIGIILVFALAPSAYASKSFKAPDFNLAGDKSNIKLSQQKGKVVYIDFWASWCKPCRKSFPFMNEMQQRYKKKGLKVIAINLDSERAAAKKFLQKVPANFTIAYDPKGMTPKAYKLGVMPTSYLIDRKGRIIDIHKGFKEQHKSKMESKIKQALAKR